MRARRAAGVVAWMSLLLVGCQSGDEPDAYGNVEAVDVIVSAETSGRIEAFAATEGEPLAAGAVAATLETTTHTLEREQLAAQREAARARLAQTEKQVDALVVQREIAERTHARTQRLHDQNAATARELDQAEREYRVLGEEIEAGRAQAAAVRKEIAAIEAQIARVAERIGKGQIVNPIAGTVLATYARAGEVAQVGQPLYRIADLDTMEVRAYVAETQLAGLRLGQAATVTVDVGEDARRAVPATVSWIAGEAEFTPTPIQTRDERTGLVYAIKLRLPNPEGILKIGMPADIDW